MSAVIRFPSREEIAERWLSGLMERRGGLTASFRQLLAKRLAKALMPLDKVREPLPLHWPPELATLTDEQSAAVMRFIEATLHDFAVMFLDKYQGCVLDSVRRECLMAEAAKTWGIPINEDG